MHVLSVSKVHWNSKKRRKPGNATKHWRCYYYDDEENRFSAMNISSSIKARLLSLKKEHRLIKECDNCGLRGQYILPNKKSGWQCARCFQHHNG